MSLATEVQKRKDHDLIAGGTQESLNTHLISQTVLHQLAPKVCKRGLVALLAVLLEFLSPFAELIWEQGRHLVFDNMSPGLKDNRLQVFGGPFRITVQGSHSPGARQEQMTELPQPWSEQLCPFWTEDGQADQESIESPRPGRRRVWRKGNEGGPVREASKPASHN